MESTPGQATNVPSRRPAVKQGHIASELRRRMVEGVLVPGSRLPTRRELETEFSASLHTVQKALDELMRDGFVYARGSRGTFVADKPPYLNHYGLIFPTHPGEGFFPRFWTALVNEALNVERGQSLRIPVYYGMEGHSDTQEYKTLVGDIQSNRLGGLIFGTNPSVFVGTPLLNSPDLPKVAIMKPGTLGDMPAVITDTAMFFRRAMEYFVSRKRRKIAVLSVTQDGADATIAAAADLGLVIPTHWIQFVNHDSAEFARNCVHLLMNPGQSERPNALLIADDNLVEHAAAGLIAAGVRIPQDVEVVAHCNFPWPTPSSVPVKRLGFDAREVLKACLDLLECQRTDGPPWREHIVPAVFEDEIS